LTERARLGVSRANQYAAIRTSSLGATPTGSAKRILKALNLDDSAVTQVVLSNERAGTISH
jgi:hypothetical protein